ncbi:hypothetical protein ILUMI_17832, partial [Ignelater luminosus]
MCYVNFVVFNLLLLSLRINSEPCKTPDNKPGECILLRECPSLREMIAKKVDGANELVRQSVCGFVDGDFLVCCVSSTNESALNQENKETNNTHLLPSRKYCGYQHSDDYFHEANTSAITEFPWLARLAYRDAWEEEDSYNKSYRCHGSLISNKYVLTAAQCLTARNL